MDVYEKNLTDDFKIFTKVLNTTNKLTGKPYYDFSDIYPELKIMYIEPMTKNGAEIYVNVEESFPIEIRREWWNDGVKKQSYKSKVSYRLYELITLLGFGYDFTIRIYP